MYVLIPRWILAQVDKDDDQVREAGRSDSSADDPALDAAGYEQDEYDYIVMDANESDDMAMRCAFITDEYTHPDVADYTEEVLMQTVIHTLGHMFMKVQQVC